MEPATDASMKCFLNDVDVVNWPALMEYYRYSAIREIHVEKGGIKLHRILIRCYANEVVEDGLLEDGFVEI